MSAWRDFVSRALIAVSPRLHVRQGTIRVLKFLILFIIRFNFSKVFCFIVLIVYIIYMSLAQATKYRCRGRTQSCILSRS